MTQGTAGPTRRRPTGGVAPLWQDPTLRLTSALMMGYGAILASISPYVAELGVREFRLGDHGYAALMVVASLLAVSASVGAGIRADQTGRRRGLALAAFGAMTLAFALMTFVPSQTAFVLAHAVLLPLSASLFGQLFALARMAADRYPAVQRDAILTTARALFAAAFVIVLPLWSVAFQAGVGVRSIYPVGLIGAVILWGLAHWGWPRDGANTHAPAPSGLSLGAALAEIAAPRLAFRVLALGAVNAATMTYMALIALVATAADTGNGAGRVALFVGFVAGLEVPFMLAVPWVAARARRTTLILVGTALYAAFIGLLPQLASGPWLWALLVPAAAGGALTLTLPIAYLQDAMAHRPGTGSSLTAVQKLAGDSLAATVFALGTAWSGYGAVGALAAVLSLAGAAGLWLADRRR